MKLRITSIVYDRKRFLGSVGHDNEVLRHHCVDYRGSYATNRWKTMKGESVYRHLLYFEISSLDSSVKRFIAESMVVELQQLNAFNFFL